MNSVNEQIRVCDMDPKLLYQFHYICELGFSVTAKWLNISRQLLTRNLQTLEMTVGQPLVIPLALRRIIHRDYSIILSEQGAQIVCEVQRAEEVINTAKPVLVDDAHWCWVRDQVTFLNEFCAEELSRSQVIPFSTSGAPARSDKRPYL